MNGKSFDEKWDTFCSHIKSEKEEYKCYFKLVGNYADSEIGTNHLAIKTGAEILDDLKGLNQKDFDHNAKYIEEKSFSYLEDSHTAVSQSLSNVSEKVAFLNYYDFKIPKFTHSQIIYPNGEKSISYELLNKQFEKNIIDQEDIVRSYNIISSSKVDIKTKTQLKNFYKQYNLSLDALSIETKYSSLWTAIESLLVTGHYSSNIEHIKKIIPSILSSQYIIRLLKNYLYDCFRINFSLTYSDVEINTKNPSNDDLKALHCILTDNTLSENLLSDIEDFILLKVRTQELIKMLENSGTLKDALINHNNTITYHIQRMYRVRNNLVHAAVSEKDISLLIDHLNFYVHATVNEIIEFLSDTEVTNLGELFMQVEDNYYAILAVLKENVTMSPKGNIIKYNQELIFGGTLY